MATTTKDNTNLVKTLCAICETDIYDEVLYPSNFDAGSLSYDVFSARRLPDRCHYRIVRCQKCGLVRSNPIADEKTLEVLYQGSHFTYERESVFASETYASYLEKALAYIGHGIRLLEIGCGNGAFFKKVQLLGVKNFFGIEPSQEAVENAGEFKSHIHKGMFGPKIHPENHFDLICAFQVFDHIASPNEFLQDCRKYLNRNGIVLFINHDIGSSLAKLFKDSNPIIDIVHTFLYDKRTLRKILEKNNFEVLDVFNVVNRYPISYWVKIMPIAKFIKNSLLKGLALLKLERMPLRLSVGNVGIIGCVLK